MEKSVIVRAPAKINLALDIAGKRADGYHFIKSIMQSVSLYDQVEIKRSEKAGIRIDCDKKNIPLNADNLAVKAASAFFSYIGASPEGLDIAIKKNIPIQAGLAGGSADAAAVLVGLNHLWEAGLSGRQLCDIGIQLGADVPFCIVGGTALAEGIGEILLPLPSLTDCSILIVQGEAGRSTSEVFRQFDQASPTEHPGIDEIIAAIAADNLNGAAPYCKNVLEQAAKLPELQEIKAAMKEYGALCSLMTGSGSAIFGLFEKKRACSACCDAIKERVSFAEICAPLKNGAEVKE